MSSYNPRQSKILEYISLHPTVKVEEVAKKFYISPSTVRRDFNYLEELGYIRRVHGGAVLTEGSTFDEPARLRKMHQLKEKSAIADLAVRFLKPSSSYFFDSSSTSAVLATKLTDFPDVILATNGVGILSEMSSTSKLTILSTGGFLRSPWNELTGNMALASINSMNADVFFFSCAGFSLQKGATEISDANVGVKRAFYEHSRKHILLCDHTKLDHDYFFISFPISRLDYLVTDQKPENPEYISLLGDRLIYPGSGTAGEKW